jgi:hypothetical protein
MVWTTKGGGRSGPPTWNALAKQGPLVGKSHGDLSGAIAELEQVVQAVDRRNQLSARSHRPSRAMGTTRRLPCDVKVWRLVGRQANVSEFLEAAIVGTRARPVPHGRRDLESAVRHRGLRGEKTDRIVAKPLPLTAAHAGTLTTLARPRAEVQPVRYGSPRPASPAGVVCPSAASRPVADSWKRDSSEKYSRKAPPGAEGPGGVRSTRPPTPAVGMCPAATAGAAACREPASGSATIGIEGPSH